MDINVFAKSFWENPLVIIAALLIFFGLIVVIVIFLRKKSSLFRDDSKPGTKDEIAQEELDRVLETVEDEDAAKAMGEYKQEDFEAKEKEEEGEDKPILK